MRILITDKVHQILPESLDHKGWHVDYNPTISLEVLPDIIHLYDGIIINSKIKMIRSLIDKGINLKFIARLGSGMEIIDIPYARSKGIRIINAPEGNSNAVGEHAMGMLLALANNIYKSHNQVTSFYWDREGNRGFEIKGKTIGIVGVGHTGSAFAHKLGCWDVSILGYDKYKDGYGKEIGIHEATLDELIQKSDIISFHLPLSGETIGYCDLKFLNACKPGVIIINTSRGQVIDTEDLIFCLENGQVGGACLDVFENEKPSTYTRPEKASYQRLFSFPNVITSPHVAGWTHESLRKIADIVLERIDSDYTIEN